jgi:hypothetical protein
MHKLKTDRLLLKPLDSRTVATVVDTTSALAALSALSYFCVGLVL